MGTRPLLSLTSLILDRSHDSITSWEIGKVLCLAFQNGSDRLDGVATVELHGERMFGQYDAGFFLVSPQDRLEKHSKMRGES